MADSICILGIMINDRIKESGSVQRVLTEYGCSIKTRLGLHEVSEELCSKSGLIILELTGPMKDQNKLKDELGKIQGITLKMMEF